MAAISVAVSYIYSQYKNDINLDTKLLALALEQVAIEPEDHNVSLISNEIVETIKYLQSSGNIEKERLARIEWMFVPLLTYSDTRPTTFINEVVNNPNLFADLICFMYKAHSPVEGEQENRSPELIKQMAENAWELLHLINKIPGQKEDAQIDSRTLEEWIEKVREECARRHREYVSDKFIGQILSRSSVGSDGVWPHEAVRNIIEKYESWKMERNIEIDLYNQQGTTIRSPFEGGTIERRKAESYREQADQIQFVWPRTAAMLRRIAHSYIDDGTLMDRHVEIRE